MARIGFGAGGHQHRRIAQWNPCFRHAKLQRHIHTGIDNRNNLGKCQTHIFRRNHHQPSAGRLHLSRLQQARQVMAGRIWVRTADGFLHGRKKVVEIIAAPVCPQCALLGHRFGVSQRNGHLPPIHLASGKEHFHGVHGLADITAAGTGDIFQCAPLHNRGQCGTVFHELHSPLHRLQCRRGINLLKLENGGTAENCIKHIEIGIFRGRCNERNLAVFDILQQTLLLLFIERLNLIQVQQNAIGGHKGIQLGHDFLDIGGGRCGGVQFVKGTVGLLGNDICNGGLTCTAGTIENHVRNLTGINEPAQDGILAQNMLLTVNFIQRGGPQQIGQWLIHRQPSFRFIQYSTMGKNRITYFHYLRTFFRKKILSRFGRGFYVRK